MALLKPTPTGGSPGLLRLPSGSFTVDPQGQVIASTLPQAFPAAQVRDISQLALWAFRAAEAVNLPLTELVLDYAAFKLTARELHGGAIIFLAPRDLAA